MCQEELASGMVRISREYTLTNLADLFTKIIPRVVGEILLVFFILRFPLRNKVFLGSKIPKYEMEYPENYAIGE